MTTPAASIRASTAGWIIWAVVMLLGLGGAAARPDGFLLGAPALAEAVLMLGSGALLARLLGPGAATACVGLLPVPVLLLTGLAVPGLGALSGPPLLALGLAGVAATVMRARPRGAGAAFLPLILALYAAAAARVQWQVGPEGDEPHYLMVADSLLRDRDLALESDYSEGRYGAFYRRPLSPHYRVRGKGGEIYSLHAVGLSLLVLPAYALGGYAGASFFMALLAALLAREIRELLALAGGKKDEAEGVAWVVALSSPIIHYAGLIFTEVPAALLVAVALRRGREPARAGFASALGCGVAIAFLPWLNVRYAALTAILLLFVLSGRPRKSTVPALFAPSIVSGLALVAYHYLLYGFFDPRRVYGRRPELSLGVLPDGLPGLLLDQEFGLLAYAPFFALAVPGLVILFREGRRHAVTSVGLVAAVILTAASWPMWRGGFNPPGRFLVPLVPVLALAVAAKLRRGAGAGALLLAGWSLWTGLGGAFEPRLVHRDRDGTAPFFRARSGAEEWTRLLPGYVLPESAPGRTSLALVWASALALTALGGRRGFDARRLALGTGGLIVAAGVASSVSPARTGGRDAVRLIGRPALSMPGWGWMGSAPAVWGPGELAWGPLYEPHRHPAGAEIGSRLALPSGGYRLTVALEELAPGLPAPLLVVRAEGGRSREVPMEGAKGGRTASFQVAPEDRLVTLALRGGGPILLKGLRLERSTFPAPGGLNP